MATVTTTDEMSVTQDFLSLLAGCIAFFAVHSRIEFVITLVIGRHSWRSVLGGVQLLFQIMESAVPGNVSAPHFMRYRSDPDAAFHGNVRWIALHEGCCLPFCSSLGGANQP
jgi:hypothetical protein